MAKALKRRGFTLIELLIVVAIIAILAAIAVPNFLEAQTRSKVARVKADMRSLAVALDSYRVDYNSYVHGNTFGVAAARPGYRPADPFVFESLSTPVAYITNALPEDPFLAKKRSGSVIGGQGPLSAAMADINNWTDAPAPTGIDYYEYRTYLYISTADSSSNKVTGITRVANDDNTSDLHANGYIINSASPMEAYINAGGVVAGWSKAQCEDLIYDPTNGTVSFGQIWRAGGSPDSQNNIIGAITTQR